MGMIRAGIDLEFSIHGLAQLRLGQHATDGLLDQAFRASLANNPRSLFVEPSFVPGVLTVELLVFLPPGQSNARRVDDDDVIACVEERRVRSFVLALEQACGRGRNPAQYLTLRINEVPGIMTSCCTR